MHDSTATDALSESYSLPPPDLSHEHRQNNFEIYLTRVAEARYVIRKVLHIADNSAKAHGLGALEHQALIQIAGTSDGSIAIHTLAERLNIAAAFCSRIVKQLEAKELIERSNLKEDKRVSLTRVTPEGLELLRKIDETVHHHMTYFQSNLGPRDRVSALAIFAFYVGEPTDSTVGKSIRMLLE